MPVSTLVAEPRRTVVQLEGSSLSSSSLVCELGGLPSKVEVEAMPPISNLAVSSVRLVVCSYCLKSTAGRDALLKSPFIEVGSRTDFGVANPRGASGRTLV
ncbi:hypothetical protein AMTR_s00104p00105710 [Amborella trichopoda]|uniref:Uncharacterized protein n=1 Tax=Amborella trichopoda TaxID=13333 RepID=W1NT22_AMBTC|nr:hypothetical protein AMTR_s00104p00105710 [Amborella trichopoda]